MCGIVGAVGWGNEQDIERMTALQHHRGPDDGGLWCGHRADGAFVGLGNRRLAIIDLSPAGHMPMASADGALQLTYNGEIYNFPALRAELENRGHTFRSHTDTEVILHLYQAEGPACFHRLNGMFALALWDGNRQELILARDHFGVKPLYYIQQGDRLAFASEIKSLFALPDMPRQVNERALHQYLTFLWVPDPTTMLQGVAKLPAGHYARFRDGKLDLIEYWDLSFPPAGHSYTLSEPELIEAVRDRFRRAVHGQMISDVPIGAFLSAGLDSSSIVAMMREASAGPVSTFTIGFPATDRRGEVTLDDTSVARQVAERFGCKHTEIIVEPDVADLLPKLVYHLDEPIADPAAITAYLVCREARKTTTVLLSGVGGDELFAGYRKHLADALAQRYQRIPAPLRRGLIEPLVSALPSLRGTPLKGYVRLAKKMAKSGSLPPRERFLMDSTYLTEVQKRHLYAPALRQALAGADPWQRHRDYYDHVADADFLNQMLYLDTKAFMVSLNLTYNDKMSMASSVEVRVPFLDKDLAEFLAWQVPPSLKLHGRTTKYILRRAMEGILPAEVLTAPKAGFGAPVDHWLAHDLRPMVDDLLSAETIRRRGYFDPAFVHKLIAEQRRGRQDWSLQIWALLTFELWLRTFVDGTPAAW